jgi:hypothetical protein
MASVNSTMKGSSARAFVVTSEKKSTRSYVPGKLEWERGQYVLESSISAPQSTPAVLTNLEHFTITVI